MALTSYFWASPKNVSPDIAEFPIIEAYIAIITPLISIDIPPSHDLINYLWIWRYPIFDIFWHKLSMYIHRHPQISPKKSIWDLRSKLQGGLWSDGSAGAADIFLNPFPLFLSWVIQHSYGKWRFLQPSPEWFLFFSANFMIEAPPPSSNVSSESSSHIPHEATII